MSGLEARRAARLGGLLFAGSALLAAAALGLEWRFAPGTLRNPIVEVVLVAAGVLLMFTVLFALVLDRWTSVPPPAPASPIEVPNSGSSLMALPAMVAPEPTRPEPAPTLPSPSPTPGSPIGLAAAPAGSTLLIPFADESTAGPAPPLAPTPGLTVTRLVDRIDALQRSPPAPPTPVLSSAPTRPEGGMASALLLRLTRIPTPPTAPATTAVARRCNDCGDPLGSPPLFEPCSDCGRALCERCYWRTSSGPQAHLCTSCFQQRSVPRPPVPTITFGRPTEAASISTPSGRALQPRRRVS